jgi:hypothetical protein
MRKRTKSYALRDFSTWTRYKINHSTPFLSGLHTGVRKKAYQRLFVFTLANSRPALHPLYFMDFWVIIWLNLLSFVLYPRAFRLDVRLALDPYGDSSVVICWPGSKKYCNFGLIWSPQYNKCPLLYCGLRIDVYWTQRRRAVWSSSVDMIIHHSFSCRYVK